MIGNRAVTSDGTVAGSVAVTDNRTVTDDGTDR